nr:FAD:protein FMN transferase [bacterium]
IVHLERGAVVTSGTYERHFLIGGRKYCHIVDPETGRPVTTDLVSVTIVDRSGARADALATTIFVMGEERGRRLIESLDETEMVVIRNDRSFSITPGLEDRLEIIGAVE